MTERNLAVEAGEQDQAEHGNGIDDHQAQLQEAVIADEAGLAAEDRQQGQNDYQRPKANIPEPNRRPAAGAGNAVCCRRCHRPTPASL